ncbi:hypothetical protein ACFV9C_06620 [Kribbella sp. NPDC059898]|uniref:hypothetical protein n=1 Tax=Kribbella sp. NPDC059898 TaxID=3346995 RepID=UPI003658309F
MTVVDEQSNTIRSGLARALDISVVIIVGVWHLAYVGPSLVLSIPAYRSAPVELVSWCVLAVLLALGSYRLLTARRLAAWPWTAAAVLATGAVAVSAVPGDEITGSANWAFGDVVLIGVLLVLRERLIAFGVVFLANIALNLAALTIGDHHLDRAVIARFVVIACADGIMIPSAVLLAARALDDVAAVAGSATRRRARSQADRQVADALHEDRRARYEALRSRVGPILDGLADGTLDADVADVQRRCAIEAARLRRLFAESDDVPDPLLHEIRACASAAERRGVLVELATAGHLPRLPLQVRRSLTEPVIEALAATGSWARITVYGEPDAVVVSAVGDCGGAADPLWLDARWDR